MDGFTMDGFKLDDFITSNFATDLFTTDVLTTNGFTLLAFAGASPSWTCGGTARAGTRPPVTRERRVLNDVIR